MADAMIQAEQSLAPAVMDIGSGILVGVTQNRRAPNPWVQKGTIDPHLGVIRIDDTKGNSLATIWNYAMHGTCYGPENMKFSNEIMGNAHGPKIFTYLLFFTKQN
jgi:neutral ceramidase